MSWTGLLSGLAGANARSGDVLMQNLTDLCGSSLYFSSQYAPRPRLEACRSLIEFIGHLLCPPDQFRHGLLQHKLIDGHQSKHWIIRPERDPVTSRYLGDQSLHIRRRHPPTPYDSRRMTTPDVKGL